MTDPSWDPQDYLFEFPDVQLFEGPIRSARLHYKVNFIWKFLLEGIFPEIRRSVEAGSELAGFVLSLAVVDFLVGYYVDRQSRREYGGWGAIRPRWAKIRF